MMRSIFKPASAVIKLVQNSGRSSPTSTVSTPPEHTTETPTFSWSASMYTTMRPLVANMSHVPAWSILSLEPWTLSDPDLSDNCSVQTTLFSDSQEPVTTGPRATTQREPNWSTPSSMSSERRPRDATVCRDSNSHTPSEAEPDPEWELFSSPRSVRNTQTGSWPPSPSSPPPKSLTPSLSPTTPPSQSISSLRTPTRPSASTTRPSTISASVLLS